MLHARLVEHLGESGWPQRFSSPPRRDGKTVRRTVGREDEKKNVGIAIHLFCLGLQCCCKRFDGRTAACLGIESYDNWAMPESAFYDLRCGGRLPPKALVAEQPEWHTYPQTSETRR
jgi:hypothetical protein